MMYVRYALLAPLSFLTNLITIALSPLLSAWSVIAGIDRLPGWFAYFHTHDDTLDGGQHQLGWPAAKGVSLWKQRMLWIIRNPAYGFDAYVFGFSTIGMTMLRDDRTGNGQWDGSGPNRRFVIMRAANGRKYFSLRRDIVWSKRFYVKFWCGWSYDNNHTDRHIIKVSCNPFKGRK